MLILRFLPPTGNNYKDNSRVARDRHKRNQAIEQGQQDSYSDLNIVGQLFRSKPSKDSYSDLNIVGQLFRSKPSRIVIPI